MDDDIFRGIAIELAKEIFLEQCSREDFTAASDHRIDDLISASFRTAEAFTIFRYRYFNKAGD